MLLGRYGEGESGGGGWYWEGTLAQKEIKIVNFSDFQSDIAHISPL